MTPGEKRSLVTETSSKVVSTGEVKPGKVSHWIHQIERINQSVESAPINTKPLSCDHVQQGNQHASLAIGSVPVTNGAQTPDAHVNEEEVCFTTIQLFTELLLMIFAASLLMIAAIVVFSKKTPAFMEQYEILPKFLFILCIIVASYSLLRWIVSKTKSLFRTSLGSEQAPAQQYNSYDKQKQHSTGNPANSCPTNQKRASNEKVTSATSGSVNNPVQVTARKGGRPKGVNIDEGGDVYIDRESTQSSQLGEVIHTKSNVLCPQTSQTATIEEELN